MAKTITCSNAGCDAVFEVRDEELGQTVTCPKCGTPNEVPLESGESATETPGGREATYHPARHQCPNCGAVLGVRAVFCPECGADIRTGAVAGVKKAKKKLGLTSFLVGGGIVVALALLVVLVVMAVRLVGRRMEEAREDLAQVAEQEVVALVEGTEEEEEALRVRVPEERLTALAEQEEQIRQAVDAYRERLKDTLSRVATAGSEQMARHWADLYAFCLENGLQTEAEQCWYQAVRLRPTDSDVNSALGRAESFSGVPVTPEQKRFLEGLQVRLRIVNHNPDFDDHSVRVEGIEEVAIPWGATTEVPVAPGVVKIEVISATRPDRVEQAIILTVQPALVYAVELKSPSAASSLPFGPLADIYNVAMEGQQVEGVTIQRTWQGDVLSARSGNVGVAGSEEVPLKMQLSRWGDELMVVGTVSVGSPYRAVGQRVFYGSSQFPLRLAIDTRAKTVALRTGVYYELQVDLADGLWGVLGTAEGDFASEWARKKLADHVERVDLDNAEMEARGELLGSWEVLARTCEEMSSARQQVDAELAFQNRAAGEPDYVDRVRLFGIEDRDRHLYLNWPRFRPALAQLTEGSYEAIIGRLQATGAAAEEAAEISVGRRSMATGPAMGPRGRPTGGGRESSFGRRPVLPRPASPFEPAAVALSEEERLYALMRILPLLPDHVALEQVRDQWSRLDQQAQVAALVSLEAVGTPQAVSYIGRLSQESPDADVVTAALLSLGAIGTPRALEYCEGPAILPAVRTASVAAKAVAGDHDTLEGLPEFLSTADAAAKAMWLGLVSQMDTPATVLALSDAVDAYGDSDSRQLIAGALARLGGQMAMTELARLMEEADSAFPSVLGRIDPQERALLIRPVGRAVSLGRGGEQAAQFLVTAGSDAAFAFLAAGAVNKANTEALRSLALQGSGQALKAAAAGAPVVTLQLLEEFRDRWYFTDETSGDWAWRAGVDSRAVRGFLEEVVVRGAGRKVKIAAARMLQEVGQPPDAEVLLALAREDKPKGVAPPPTGTGRRGRGGPPGGARRGPPRDMRRGPPDGIRSGRGAAAGLVEQYEPSDFEQPRGVPQEPLDFRLEAKAELYALGMLMKMEDETVAAQLLELADSYEDLQLKTAGMCALGAAGGEAGLEFLRQKATASTGSYSSAGEFLAELQDRLAALAGLGLAQDTAFLPRLLDILAEDPPAADAIAEVGDEYADLSGWWQITLWAGACDCLTRMCRDRQLIELTADSALQRQMARRIMSLIDQPGSDRESLAEARQELMAKAVRAFGRCASFYDEHAGVVLNRLAVSVSGPREDQPTSPRSRATGGPGSARGRPGFRGRSRRGRQEEATPIKGALQDAVVHMAVRGDGLGVLREVPGLLPTAGRPDPGWNALVKGLAKAPTPEYFGLVNLVFDTLDWETRQAIFRLTRGSAAAYGTQYAQFVAKMIKEPAEGAEVVARGRAGPPGGPPGGPMRDPGWMPPEAIEAKQRAMAEARQRGMAEGRRASQAARQAEIRTYARGPSAAVDVSKPEVSYDRRGARRMQPWSYSLEGLPAAAERNQRKWSLVELLLESGSTALAAAMEQEALLDYPEFGPAIAAAYVERVPGERERVVGQLSPMLVGEGGPAGLQVPGPGFGPPVGAGVQRMPWAPPTTLKTKRAVVAALRRIGGDSIAEALFLGLVGPPVEQQVQMGAPRGPGTGRAGISAGRPTGVMGLMGAPMRAGAAGTGEVPVAVYIARALGTMGRADLLRQALNAPLNEFFRQDPTAVQKAALEGLAYLPADQDPVSRLADLLRLASTAELRQATSKALVTALRRMAAATAGR